MHAARGIEKLRAADSADVIVDGLLRRRAAVYVRRRCARSAF
jgi:hypothetical protein